MTNETKQTAVEWLESRITTLIPDDIGSQLMYKSNIKKAKEMEKEQKQFMFDCGRQYQLTGEGTFTEVYNETYGGNK